MVFGVSCQNDTLEIYDKIERRMERFGVEGWEFTNKGFEFRFHVDETFSGKCREMKYVTHPTYIRRRDDFELIVQVHNGANRKLAKGEYIVDINAHFKMYVYVNSAIRIECDGESNTSLSFDPDAELIFGVRSFHRQPSTKIKVTKNLKGIARAVSLLSSSIKVASPERSYPTLRGHPPLIEFSKTPSDGAIKKPESGVAIHIPKNLAYLYVASPLVYYLLADIRFGKPGIACENDFWYPLSRFPRFEDDVSGILQKVFFLDCLVRNAGLYKPNLHELNALEGLGLDIGEIYSMRIQDQLPIYLGIPMEKLKPFMPQWHLASYVEPVPERARGLPFLLDRLSVIHMPRYERISQRDLAALTIKDLIRSNVFAMMRNKSLARPLLKDSDSHLWLAKEKPVDIAKVDENAFYNRLKYDAPREGIRVALVVNDEKMLQEIKMIMRIYAERRDIPLQVVIHEFLSRKELAELFGEEYDLIHYVGHCEEKGLQCNDGFLCAKEIPANKTPAFFLNACRSYEEGMELIRKGSVGGVVTLYYVPNEQALRMGYNFARLLNLGFSIDKSIAIAKTGSLSGKDYLVVGDGGYCLIQNPRLNTVYLLDVWQIDSNRFRVADKNYDNSVGGYFYSDLDGKHYLYRGEVRAELSRKELMKYLKKGTVSQPILYENRLFFVEEFFEHLKNKKEGDCSL